jgi:ankyrin repeat protein
MEASMNRILLCSLLLAHFSVAQAQDRPLPPLLPGPGSRRPFLADLDPDKALEAALIAAGHCFAKSGDIHNLAAILKKYPKLINEKQRFSQPRMPEPEDGRTMLHLAVSYEQYDIASYLLQKGADVDSIDSSDAKRTPLHLAAQRGNLKLVRLLIRHGAKVNAKTEAIPEHEAANGSGIGKPSMVPAEPSYTPLDLAAKKFVLDPPDRKRKQEVAEYLRSVGAEPADKP